MNRKIIAHASAMLVVGVALLIGTCGCALFDTHAKEFDTIYKMSNMVQEKLGEDGVGQFSVSAEGINPGIRLEAGITYFAVARYEGVAGQLSASGHGSQSAPIADDIRKRLLDIAQDTSMSLEARQAAVEKVVTDLLKK